MIRAFFLAAALLLAGRAAAVGPAAASAPAPARARAVKTAPAAAAAPAGSAAPAVKHPKRSATPAWKVDARVLVYAGAFNGMGVRRDGGGLAGAEAVLVPELRAGDWRLSLPLKVAHRETLGASLSETTFHLAAEPAYRLSRALELGVEAGLAGAWRPGWPDLYQRTADGFMPGTDRYSYLAWGVGASLHARPFDRQHLRLGYRYVSTTYRQDSAFDPAIPMHLTPRDNGQHRLDASWRVFGDGYAVAFRVGYDRREDFTLLARDAGTGFARGNPLQRLDSVEPSVELELKGLGERMDVKLEYGYEVQRDRFQGYYSYEGHHPTLIVGYAFTDRLSGKLRAEGWLRAYGPDSKTNTSDGNRLRDDKGLLRGQLRYALRDGLALVGDAEWVRRSTNYPDYVPGVFPLSRFYDITWSYDNVRATAGVEWRL